MFRLRVHTIVQSAWLEYLTGTERQEDCRSACGKPPLNFHLIDTQRERGQIALFLLIVQPDQVTVVGVGDTIHRIDDVFQLLFRGGGMHQKDCDHEHLFIMVLQILQQLFRFLAERHQIGRQNIHIETGAHRPLLFVNLCLVQIAQFPLDRFQRGPLVECFGVNADNLAAFDIQQRIEQGIVNLGGPDLQKGNRAA